MSNSEKPDRSPLWGRKWLRQHKYITTICPIIILFALSFLTIKAQIPAQYDEIISLYDFEEEVQDEEIIMVEANTYRSSGGRALYLELELEVEDEVEEEVASVVSLAPTAPVQTNPTVETVGRTLSTTPVAEQIWSVMQEYGWDPVIAAGILGNMMAEVGGQTLDLKWDADTGGYYGLCMWAKKYFPNITGLSVEEQMDFLREDLDMSIFKGCITPAQTALSFAKNYERCGSRSYKKRQQNAQLVYNTFAK